MTGFDAAPTVLSQVQTYNGSDWVTTRIHESAATQFKFGLQEEALNHGGHVYERVGWLAMDLGLANDGDSLLQGGLTSRQYRHQPATVVLGADFATTPSVIAKVGAFYGPDTANIRLEDIDRQSFGVRVVEEQSLDSELHHTQESIAFLALEGESGELSGLAV